MQGVDCYAAALVLFGDAVGPGPPRCGMKFLKSCASCLVEGPPELAVSFHQAV
jgi:hypothetical protein